MEKSKFLTVRKIILSVLIGIACIFVYPLHKQLTYYAQNSAVKFKTQMEEEIGLKISYKRLSPSILSTLVVSGITVNNLDNEKIVTIEKTKISFKLFRLLKGDFQRGFSSVTIDGVDIDITELVDFINFITEKFSNSQNENQFDIENLTSVIPQNIKLKNISVSYTNEDLTASVTLKEVGIDNNVKRSALNLDLTSVVKLQLNKVRKNISCNLDATGTLFKSLDNSSLSIKLQNLTEGTYKLSKLAMLLSYADKVVDVHTIQSTNPISIDAQYDFSKQKANARVRTQTFSPITVLSSMNSDAAKQLKLFKDFLIDTDTSATFDLSDIENPDINYKSRGYVYVPNEIFPQGATVEYGLKGNEDKIDIEKLNVTGPNCNAAAQLSLVFKTLQANGFIELPYFVLPNGNILSTEVYVDALTKGFMVFSPQTFVGNKALTAIQLSVMPEEDSYDFVFEATDYSHFENGDPGEIKIDGSYLVKSQYLQASASLLSFFADSLVDFGIEGAPSEVTQTLTNVRNFVEPYVISADAYFSTNFKTFSFNVPYVLIANTQGENQVLMVSANGNNDSIQLNQLSLVYGKFATSASGSLDINSETKDMFYTVDFNASSVPYHFSGSIMKEIVTLSGDYSTDGEVRFTKNKDINGHLIFENLPFLYGDKSFVFTIDSDFVYDQENGPNVNINRLSLEAVNSAHTISPKLNAAGNITKYGAQLTSVGYTDFYSSLVGTADVTLNINNEVFDSAGLILNLKNPLSDESISLDANVSNPDMVALNAETIMKSLYLSAQLQVNNLSLNRISNSNNAANLLTASLFATGTLEHPFVSLNMEEASILLGSNFLSVNGNATLEDKTVSISDFKVSFAALNFTDIQAVASLEDMNASASCNFEMQAGQKSLVIPIDLKLSETVLGKDGKTPESFVLEASTKKVSGSLIKNPFNFGLTALYSDGNCVILSTDNVGLTGNFYKPGMIQATMKNNFANIDMFANFAKEDTIIDLTNINVNLANMFSNINLDDYVQIKSGVVEGNFAIKGRLDDPDLEGILQVRNPVAKVPFIFDKDLSSSQVVIQGISNEIHLLDATYKLNNTDKIQTGLDLSFNKGALNQMDVRLKSYKKELVPMNVKLPWLKVSGDFSYNLDLNLSLDDKLMKLNGKVFSENFDVNSNIYSIAANVGENETGEPMNVLMNLDCNLGTHASITFDPLLRCVFVPNTHVIVQIDSAANIYNIDGLFNLRAGDIAYLNRSFYIKSGSIKLNPSDLGNPQITFNAETRERDSSGQNIKIMLSAENQYLLSLKPKISSNPPKSELELQSLLGQIVAADSENASNFLFAAGDYAVQSLLFRQTENKLRDLLNFDIFSLRTNVLQNALNLSVANNPSQDYSFGNLFDNSTVYIGKYLGSSLYFDAMLQVSFEDSIVRNITAPGALVLQPEIGLELESPFGNIRWNFAPDIEALKNNQYVPASSVSLLWKFTF